jgi:hypothetical protein
LGLISMTRTMRLPPYLTTSNVSAYSTPFSIPGNFRQIRS